MITNTNFLAKIAALLFLLSSCMRPYQHPAEKNLRHSLERYGLQVAEKNHLQLLLVGSVNEVFSDYCMLFTSDKEMTLEEGKALAVPLAQNLLNEVLHNSAVANFVANDRGKPPQANNIGFKIAFWDKEVNRPNHLYLAQITLSAGILYFYEADPKTQKLILIFQQPYQ
jgi:hypothetical protein